MKRWLAAFALILGTTTATAGLASSSSDLSACERAKAEAEKAKTAEQLMRNLEQAIDLCTRAINAGGLDQARRAAAYNMRGDINWRRRNLNQAISDFSEVIALTPGRAQGYLSRASAFRDNGQYDRAFADYDSAVRVERNNPNVFRSRGFAHERQGQFDKAIADYSEMIRLQPNAIDGICGPLACLCEGAGPC